MTLDASLSALLSHAAALRRAGRHNEAAEAYERLLAQRPDLPDCWYNLGLMRRRLGLFQAALDAYQAALDRGASGTEEIHLNRAVIYADDLRRYAEAETELKAALARNPAYVPALLNLGNLEEDRGRRAEARALYERALSIDPRAWEALARLANLSNVERREDALIARLEQALARADAGAADKASLGFALGRALDAAGAYEEAFTAYAQANAMSRASNPARAVYDPDEETRSVDEIIAAFPAATVRATVLKAEDHVAPAPIFICGMFRSGSTLCEQVLSGHKRITAGGELALVPTIVRDELSPFPAGAGSLAERAGPLAERYRVALGQLFPDADLVTDKRPDNYRYIGAIKALFPAAKIVNTLRHPLDTCLSIYFLHLDHGKAYALDLMDTAHHYLEYRRLMAHWRALYGPDIIDFDYDAFVRAPREEAGRLLNALGLDWSEACLDFHARPGPVKTASVWQVREPLYSRASGRWRNYARQLEPLRRRLGLPD